MTDTITRADTTTTEDATEGTVRIPPAAARECLDVDPTTLIIGDNVRAGAHLDRQFLASLREFGVMDPVHVIRADDGTLTVKAASGAPSAQSRWDGPPSRSWSSATTTARRNGSPSSGTRTNAATP